MEQPVLPANNLESQELVQPNPEIYIPEKPKTNYWIISTFILLFIILGFGAYSYLSSIKSQLLPQNQEKSDTKKAEQKDDSDTSSSSLIEPNQIRMGGIYLPIPEGLTPVFASPMDGKSVVYLAASEEEVQQLSGCAEEAKCGEYSLKLADFSNSAVWQNTSIEDFIKQVKPEIQIDKLNKTVIDGHEAWTGYSDNDKKIYSLAIDTSKNGQKSVSTIIISTIKNDSSMIESYIGKLSSIKVVGTTETKQSELSPKIGYELTIDSSLVTQDNQLVNSIITSYLAPPNSSQGYEYFTYTSSNKSVNGNAGEINYPKGDFLNYKYFLLTNNNQLVESVYGTSQIKITLSKPQSTNLGDYLADAKYCATDNDCMYRSNFCTIGAYNQYHQFAGPWGCGPAELEGLGNSMELSQSLKCKLDAEMKYDELKCVNNSCKAINPQAVCKH